MSLLKRLFGGSDSPEPEPELYNGFAITPTPIAEGNVYRISAKIEKEIEGEIKTHTLIRADTIGGLEAATEASLDKARQVIDSLGDGVFR